MGRARLNGQSGRKINGVNNSLLNDIPLKINTGDIVELRTSFDTISSDILTYTNYTQPGDSCVLDDNHVLTVQLAGSTPWAPTAVIQTLNIDGSTTSLTFSLLGVGQTYTGVDVIYIGDNIAVVRYYSIGAPQKVQALSISSDFTNITVGNLHALSTSNASCSSSFVYLDKNPTTTFVNLYINSSGYTLFTQIITLTKDTLTFQIAYSGNISYPPMPSEEMREVLSVYPISATQFVASIYMTYNESGGIRCLFLVTISSSTLTTTFVTPSATLANYTNYFEHSGYLYGVRFPTYASERYNVVDKYLITNTDITLVASFQLPNLFKVSTTSYGPLAIPRKLVKISDYPKTFALLSGVLVSTTSIDNGSYGIGFLSLDNIDAPVLLSERIALPLCRAPKSIDKVLVDKLHCTFGTNTPTGRIQSTITNEYISGVRGVNSKYIGVAVNSANTGELLKLITH